VFKVTVGDRVLQHPKDSELLDAADIGKLRRPRWDGPFRRQASP
jgi:hypothetical protein